MIIELLHPGIAATPCSICSTRLVDHKTGIVTTEKRGDVEFPILRDKPPCRGTYQCPKVSPEHEHLYVLTDDNRRCWRFYRRQKAGGFPDVVDDLCLENFAIIAEIEQLAERQHLVELLYPKVQEANNGP